MKTQFTFGWLTKWAALLLVVMATLFTVACGITSQSGYHSSRVQNLSLDDLDSDAKEGVEVCGYLRFGQDGAPDTLTTEKSVFGVTAKTPQAKKILEEYREKFADKQPLAICAWHIGSLDSLLTGKHVLAFSFYNYRGGITISNF